MASYISVVKVEQQVVMPQTSNDIIINSSDIALFCSNMYNQTKTIKNNKMFTNNQFVFYDINGEAIYNLYYLLRQKYKDSGLFHDVDYNGFLDIFINNISFEELQVDSDDDQINDDE